MRMLISEHEVKYCKQLLMSYPEVLDPEPNTDYANAVINTKKLQEEVQSRQKDKKQRGET